MDQLQVVADKAAKKDAQKHIEKLRTWNSSSGNAVMDSLMLLLFMWNNDREFDGKGLSMQKILECLDQNDSVAAEVKDAMAALRARVLTRLGAEQDEVVSPARARMIQCLTGQATVDSATHLRELLGAMAMCLGDLPKGRAVAAAVSPSATTLAEGAQILLPIIISLPHIISMREVMDLFKAYGALMAPHVQAQALREGVTLAMLHPTTQAAIEAKFEAGKEALSETLMIEVATRIESLRRDKVTMSWEELGDVTTSEIRKAQARQQLRDSGAAAARHKTAAPTAGEESVVGAVQAQSNRAEDLQRQLERQQRELEALRRKVDKSHPQSQSQSQSQSRSDKKDVECFNCGKKGHYQRTCQAPCGACGGDHVNCGGSRSRGRGREGGDTKFSSTGMKNNRRNRGTDCSGASTTPALRVEAETVLDLAVLNRVTGWDKSEGRGPLMCDVDIVGGDGETTATACVDSGACVSAITHALASRLYSDLEERVEEIELDDPVLVAANGMRFALRGKLREVVLYIGQARIMIPVVYVVTELRPCEFILGLYELFERDRLEQAAAAANKKDIKQRRKLFEVVSQEGQLKVRVGGRGAFVPAAPMPQLRRPALPRSRRHEAPVALAGVTAEAEEYRLYDESSSSVGRKSAPLVAELAQREIEATRAERAQAQTHGAPLPAAVSGAAGRPEPAGDHDDPAEVAYRSEFRKVNAEAHKRVVYGDADVSPATLAALKAVSSEFAAVFADKAVCEERGLKPPFMQTRGDSPIKPMVLVARPGMEAATGAQRTYKSRDDEYLQKELGALVDTGRVVEPNLVASVANAFIVKTVDAKGNVKRRCVQAHLSSNQLTVPSALPMPNPDEQKREIAKGKYFIVADALEGFTAMPLAVGSGALACMAFGDKVVEPRYIPMGVSAAPQHFNQCLNAAFSKKTEHWQCLVFIDDVFASADSEEALVELWQHILSVCAKWTITLSATKCQVGKLTVNLLGSEVSQGKFVPKRSFVDAVAAVERPQTVHETRRLCGLVGWMLPHRVEAAAPLHAFQVLAAARGPSKAAKIVWTDELEEAFVLLKKLLAEPRALIPFDATRALLCITDASSVGGGAILAHVSLDGKGIDVIDALAHHFTAAEQVYATQERELALMRMAAERWSEYMVGRAVYWLTDCKPMAQMLSSAHVSDKQRIRTTALDLAGLDIVCVYVPGSVNEAADALSRNPAFKRRWSGRADDDPVAVSELVLSAVTMVLADRRRALMAVLHREAKAETRVLASLSVHFGVERCESHLAARVPVFMAPLDLELLADVAADAPRAAVASEPAAAPVPGPQLSPSAAAVRRVRALVPDPHVHDEWLALTKSDPSLGQLREVADEDKGGIAASEGVMPQWVEGYLAVRGTGSSARARSKMMRSSRLRVVVPAGLRTAILEQLHTVLGCGSLTKLMTHMLDNFYWPGLARDVRRFLTACAPCQAIRHSKRKASNMGDSESGLEESVQAPREGWQVDTWSSNEMELRVQSAVDLFSGFVVLTVLADGQASTAAQAFKTRVMQPFGARFVKTDGGKENAADFIAALSERGCNHIVGMPYNHDTIAKVERRNRMLNEFLVSYLAHAKAARRGVPPKEDLVAMAQESLNLMVPTVPAGVAAKTPSELFFGTKPMLPLRIVVPKPTADAVFDIRRAASGQSLAEAEHAADLVRFGLQLAYELQAKDGERGPGQPDTHTRAQMRAAQLKRTEAASSANVHRPQPGDRVMLRCTRKADVMTGKISSRTFEYIGPWIVKSVEGSALVKTGTEPAPLKATLELIYRVPLKDGFVNASMQRTVLVRDTFSVASVPNIEDKSYCAVKPSGYVIDELLLGDESDQFITEELFRANCTPAQRKRFDDMVRDRAAAEAAAAAAKLADEQAALDKIDQDKANEKARIAQAARNAEKAKRDAEERDKRTASLMRLRERVRDEQKWFRVTDGWPSHDNRLWGLSMIDGSTRAMPRHVDSLLPSERRLLEAWRAANPKKTTTTFDSTARR